MSPELPLGLGVFLAHIVVAATAVVHVLLYKSDSRATFGWLGLILVFPLVGALLYLLFGINRVRRKARRGAARDVVGEQASLPDLDREAEAALPGLETVGWRITGHGLSAGNGITPLHDGEQAFPAMLEAIAQAGAEVLLSTYIFDRDETGREFVDALKAASDRGARVRILLDDFGRRYSIPTVLPRLRKAGLDTRLFMPLSLVPPSLSLNLRNHRKLLVVDNRVGFAGGMNIGERQLALGISRHRASDLHFRFTGPVVDSLRELFLDDWAYAGGERFEGTSVPEPGSADECCRCRVVPDGPDAFLEHLGLLINGVVAAARHRVWIVTPYFLPDRKLMGCLQAAALKGLDVKVVVPETNNLPPVHWAMFHNAWELIVAGVHLYEQPPPFAHSKCLLVDDEYALIGSTNLDARSLRLNFEVGIEVFGKSLNATLSEHVETLLGRSRPITRQRVLERSLPVRLRDALAALFSPYL